MAPKRTPAAASSAAASGSSGPVSAPSPQTTAAPSSLSSGPKTLTTNSSIFDIAHTVWQQYLATTPQRTLLLDAFMAFLVLVGGVQFVYCVLAGNYPFNAFLSGFSAAVGQFVLTASLRMQTSSPSSSTTSGEEGAFADYVFGSLILHFFCINFIN
ncbi:defender against death DAD protein [Aspergillus heteromorphus CBS 117.55]|uniref:Dolichyl-diphosphooligosaccharide--protein glycosyltransferase subunit OST2 n=1 Tax=Aspergillus heteromorphus CBS 117.55 TaxID=1448321 RepID=A0A317WD47_9EURO|nr:defender against death DAD protein [Aspergillus heteromorphus CBS 117.55]PWY82958.1 defender against death DAD protein [Aspergillus heteromorphus CBS 117.55]